MPTLELIAQIEWLRGLVRELGKAGVTWEGEVWFCGFCGNSGTSLHDRLHYDNCILNRPEVRKIMGES